MSAPSPVRDAGAVLPQTVWPDVLRETAIEVFATMVGATLKPSETNGVPVIAQMTGMVGIAGPLIAVFSLRCSERAATTIASQMLGVSLEDAAAQKSDAVGEICNMVAGYFKAKIGLGDQCKLSVPTILAGTDYKIHRPGKSKRLELMLLYEREPILMTLDIRP
jgi:chemotaxis protein CheX